jgi:copper(I)-binding protein
MKKFALALVLCLFAIPNAKACDTTFEIRNAWVKPTMEGKNITAAFLDLKNTSDKPRKLTAVSSPAGVAEMHNTIMDNGVMKMRQMEFVEIPAGKTVNFKPKAMHIMLVDLKKPLKEGDKVKLSFYFDNDETANITLPVSAAPATGKSEPEEHLHH